MNYCNGSSNFFLLAGLLDSQQHSDLSIRKLANLELTFSSMIAFPEIEDLIERQFFICKGDSW